VRNTAPAGEEHRRPDVRQRDRIPEAASWKITGKLKTEVNILGIRMKVVFFVVGALVGAYYNTIVLALASETVHGVHVAAQRILQLLA
jgi:hypothetical protein